MKISKLIVLLPFLAACGGGSSVIQEEQVPVVVDQKPVKPPATTAAELLALHTDIDERAIAENPFTTETMPKTGSATFKGAVEYYNDFGDPELYSAATLTANFANSTMAGVLDNFAFLADETRVPGQVNLVNGQIFNDEYLAELEGSLTLEDETVPLNGNVGGNFYRSDASLIDGVVTLTDGDFVGYGFLVAEK